MPGQTTIGVAPDSGYSPVPPELFLEPKICFSKFFLGFRDAKSFCPRNILLLKSVPGLYSILYCVVIGSEEVMAEASEPCNPMKVEADRLETFKRLKWPDWAPVGCEKLAKAGFFYAGKGDEVQCFSCGGRHAG